jgi:hypothetical protein
MRSSICPIYSSRTITYSVIRSHEASTLGEIVPSSNLGKLPNTMLAHRIISVRMSESLVYNCMICKDPPVVSNGSACHECESIQYVLDVSKLGGNFLSLNARLGFAEWVNISLK